MASSFDVKSGIEATEASENGDTAPPIEVGDHVAEIRAASTSVVSHAST